MAESSGESSSIRVSKIQPVIDPRSYKIIRAMESHQEVDIQGWYYYDGGNRFTKTYGSSLKPLMRLSSEGRRHGKSVYWMASQIGFIEPLSRKVIGRRIRDVARNHSADLIHTNGSPDVLGALAKKGRSVPVVHEIYDTYSLYDAPESGNLNSSSRQGLRMGAHSRILHRLGINWERYVHEHCDGLVFTSEEMMKKSVEMYGKLKSTVVPNGVLKSDLPKRRLEKISLSEGGIHCVYVGAVHSGLLHRMIIPQIRKVVERSGMTLHLYPTGSDVATIKELLRDHIIQGKVRLHEPLCYTDLYLEITKYDLGLVLLNPGNEKLLDVALPNKIFEYVAAGLPTAVPPYKSLLNFISRFSCGFPIYDWSEDVLTNEDKIREVDFREEFTIDFYMNPLIKMYKSVCDAQR